MIPQLYNNFFIYFFIEWNVVRGSRNDMTITSTMNDDIKMWCSVFGNVKPFVDFGFGESHRRLLDVEIENLCVFAGVPRSDVWD